MPAQVLSKLGDEMARSANTTVTLEGAELYPPKPQKMPLFMTRAPATYDKVALVSAALGAVAGVGLLLAFTKFELGVYLVSMAVFHLLEFWVTAKYNPKNLGMNSFLLTNGIAYVVAQVIAAAEIAFHMRKPTTSNAFSPTTLLALTMVIGGQLVRTLAMIQAAESFNHFVQVEKQPQHRLVTSGVYAYIRHPSYFGYYIWAIGTQLLVRNWATFFSFMVLLNVYFQQRLGPEEAALRRFFGVDYAQYQKNVWSGIPFY